MIRFFFILIIIHHFSTNLFSQDYIKEIDSLVDVAKELRDKNQLNEAIVAFNQALDVSLQNKDSINIAKVYNYLGTTYRRNNNKKKSLNSVYKAIKINKAIENRNGLIYNYNNLANYYNNEESYDLAYKYYKLAEELLLIENHKRNLAGIELNIATLFSNQKSGFYSYDSAVIYILKSLELFTQLEDTLNQAYLYNNLGFLYEKNGNLQPALESYQQSIELKSEIGDSSGLAVSFLNIGNVYLQQDEFEKSIEYYNKSLALSHFVGNPNHDLHLLFNMVKAKMGVGLVEEATSLLGVYNNLRDSIYDLDKMQEIKDIETKYETEKKEEEIRMQEMAIRQKTFQSNLFLGLSILLVILVVSTVFFFLQKQDYVKKLRVEEIATMKTEQELKELNAMMHGQEEERNRIANDLHDRLGARLSSIKLLFQSDDSQEMKLKVLDSINEAIKETREISHNLSTDMLTRFGIETAIKDTVRSINDAGKIQADFVSYGLQERLPLEIERNIYHVTLELINNTLKHANANHLLVQISCVDDEINVFYEDDGDGFDLNKVEGSGMGLRGIYARMNSIKGAVYVNTKPGKGLNVVLSIPLVSVIPLVKVKREEPA
ncbi:tetratricopeptide repeat protein [Marivirga sp. S37H4]|uniref:histidine kinase n=1 Tax=Marivirga aurantiaca TaxID=2802615 RepID=A0A934X304_9BACT|nr:tetratricopeptide repeat-containing sensor histidine kinase [Marivirga aurantiaca]MBK6267440.1 tetratricopeptide repeat protein [Marivirga aurantiaca]